MSGPSDGYDEGDVLIVERMGEVDLLRHQDDVIVDLDGSGRLVLRRWHVVGAMHVLYPLNEAFPLAQVGEGMTLWGRVMAVVRVK